MRKSSIIYFIFFGIIIFFIGLNFKCYKELEELNSKNSSIHIKKQTELKKSDELKRSFGYSDIINFSSSNDGMKIMSIEKSEGERKGAKVNFQYKGNHKGLENILALLEKQENLISVSGVKISYNKKEESILANINVEFIKNK